MIRYTIGLPHIVNVNHIGETERLERLHAAIVRIIVAVIRFHLDSQAILTDSHNLTQTELPIVIECQNVIDRSILRTDEILHFDPSCVCV